jgi:hypothetical protein
MHPADQPFELCHLKRDCIVHSFDSRPTDKTLSFSWSWRPKSLEQLDDAIRLTTRRDVRVLRGFILGLAIKVFREDPERWISYSRNKNWYRWAMRSRYWPVRNMYASMISAVDQLAAADLIQNHVAPRGNLGEQSRFRATSKLMALVEETDISLMLDRPEIIILRDAHKHPISYEETRETGRMRRALEEYNRSAASLHVCVAGQKLIEGDPLVVGETRTGAATLQAYRLFNESFRLGGRFYGQSTQNIPKELRATITINESATDEPDFPSLHPQLLYALVGRHLPHDPYDLEGWDRPTVKRAFNIMLNAKTPGSAMLALAETMGGFTKQHREQAKRLIAEIEHKHAPVAEHFGSGIGLRLQRTDSDIAARVLAKSSKEGECLLSLHDGFRSRRQYADRTREIMDECYEKVVGQVPAISTLKRKADLQIWSPVPGGWVVPRSPAPACLVGDGDGAAACSGVLGRCWRVLCRLCGRCGASCLGSKNSVVFCEPLVTEL